MLTQCYRQSVFGKANVCVWQQFWQNKEQTERRVSGSNILEETGKNS